MKLSFASVEGDTFSLDLEPTMTIQQLSALVAPMVSRPMVDLYLDGKQLTLQSTLLELKEHEMLMVVPKRNEIDDNMMIALQDTPESFCAVDLFFVELWINNVSFKALVDTGAQMSVISSVILKQCGLFHLLDTRFKTMALGVGSAPVLGRVHAAQIRIGEHLLVMCTFHVVDSIPHVILGLDMLRRHGAVIDVGKRTLKIQGFEITIKSS